MAAAANAVPPCAPPPRSVMLVGHDAPLRALSWSAARRRAGAPALLASADERGQILVQVSARASSCRRPTLGARSRARLPAAVPLCQRAASRPLRQDVREPWQPILSQSKRGLGLLALDWAQGARGARLFLASDATQPASELAELRAVSLPG